MKLDTRTFDELVNMLAYEVNVESRRGSADRVERSRKKIERLRAEISRRYETDAREARHER